MSTGTSIRLAHAKTSARSRAGIAQSNDAHETNRGSNQDLPDRAGRFSATLNGELLQGCAFLSSRVNILSTYASAGNLPTSIGIGGNINGGGNPGGTGICC